MRYVFLPQDIFKDLLSLADDLPNETQGFLIYKTLQQGDDTYCIVMTSYMTSIGDERGVRSSWDRDNVLNTFLEEFEDYRQIRFHTHTKKTMNYRDPEEPNRDLGYNFSTIDDKGIESALVDDPNHIEMLITPHIQILKSRDNPILDIVDDANISNLVDGDYYEERKEIDDALTQYEKYLNVPSFEDIMRMQRH